MKINIKEVMKFMEHNIPFNKFLGMKIISVDRGKAVFELPFKKDFIGDPFRPALHGGVISSLIDTCGGAAVFSEVEPLDRVSTVDLRVDYLLPGDLTDLICIAKVIRIGNHVGVSEMIVFPKNKPEKIMASGKGVYNIKRTKQALQNSPKVN